MDGPAIPNKLIEQTKGVDKKIWMKKFFLIFDRKNFVLKHELLFRKDVGGNLTYVQPGCNINYNLIFRFGV